MNRKKHTAFLFLALLAFCGQVVAMPFLDCCFNKGNSSADMGEMPHRSMVNMFEEHQHDHQSMTVENQSMMGIHDEGMDCDHQCDFCLGTAPTLTNESTFSLIVFDSYSISNYQSLYLSELSDNPFRPPISA